MKKIISLLLVFIFIIGTLTACGNKKTNNIPTDDQHEYKIPSNEATTSSSESSTTSELDKTPDIKDEENSTDNKVNSNTSEEKLDSFQLSNYGLDASLVNNYNQDGRYVKIKSSATEQDYNSFLNSLLKDGYSKYDQNQIGKSKFTTLTSKNMFVSLCYFAGTKTLKVVSEPISTLYPRQSDNKYQDKGIASLFTGIKSPKTEMSKSGLNFIIKLSDGSFIIIDGGEGDSRNKEADYLMTLLKERAPEGTEKPVIAAWIFTHIHGDHTGLFYDFAPKYKNDVIIESFYYSFPSSTGIRVTGYDTQYETFMKCVKSFPKAKRIRPHTGEKYYIRNAVIEMLFTYEDLFPKSFDDRTLRDHNDASLIFKMTVGGQDMMITGDSDKLAMDFCTSNYQNALQCDILQMSHHGQNGTVAFYSAVNPTYAILPINHYDANRLTFNDANKWLKNSTKVKQFISFATQTVNFPLPYNPKDSDIYAREPKATATYKNYPLR